MSTYLAESNPQALRLHETQVCRARKERLEGQRVTSKLSKRLGEKHFHTSIHKPELQRTAAGGIIDARMLTAKRSRKFHCLQDTRQGPPGARCTPHCIPDAVALNDWSCSRSRWLSNSRTLTSSGCLFTHPPTEGDKASLPPTRRLSSKWKVAIRCFQSTYLSSFRICIWPLS